VAPAVHRENDGLDMQDDGESHQTREQLQITLNWKEQRLAMLKEHCEIIGQELETATEAKKRRDWEKLGAVTEDPSLETLRPAAAKEKKKKKRIDVSPAATLPDVLAERMRPWNKVTPEAVEARARPQPSDDADREVVRLKRRLAEINAVLAKFKL
jgi:hypothetical protein